MKLYLCCVLCAVCCDIVHSLTHLNCHPHSPTTLTPTCSPTTVTSTQIPYHCHPHSPTYHCHPHLLTYHCHPHSNPLPLSPPLKSPTTVTPTHPPTTYHCHPRSGPAWTVTTLLIMWLFFPATLRRIQAIKQATTLVLGIQIMYWVQFWILLIVFFTTVGSLGWWPAFAAATMHPLTRFPIFVMGRWTDLGPSYTSPFIHRLSPLFPVFSDSFAFLVLCRITSLSPTYHCHPHSLT